jgi:hypothetical protein
MGIVVRHTDLSMELPGPRAIVDLPLKCDKFGAGGSDSATGTAVELLLGIRDEPAGESTGLDDIHPLWP